ncbi:MAG: right-handed parallel beta-helix repeat-containing protein [bacterium]|nr:right-handed parallel beta-helix repeat-containing protein [bacterium]
MSFAIIKHRFRLSSCTGLLLALLVASVLSLAPATLHAQEGAPLGSPDTQPTPVDPNAPPTDPISGEAALQQAAPMPQADPNVGMTPAVDGAVIAANVQQTIYVNQSHPNASDSNNGSTSDRPVRTIGRAESLASNFNRNGVGVRILISAGTYREKIQYSGRTSAAIVFEAASPGQVILSGSDVWTGWTHHGNNYYSHPWNYNWGYMPIPSGWESVNLAPIVRRREMIFVDGQLLYQVMSANAVAPGTFYVDEAQNYVLMALSSSLGSKTVEVAVREELLNVSNAQNVIVRGITFQHAAAPWEDNGVYFNATQNVLIENNTFTLSNGGGLGVGRSSNVTTRNNTYALNGRVGYDAHYSYGLLSENERAVQNNWRGAMGELYGWAAAGFKHLTIRGGTYRNLYACNNYAHGLWFDTDVRNILIEDTVLCNNTTNGLYLEASLGPFVIRESILSNNERAGVRVANSANMTFHNNIFYGNDAGQITLTGQNGGRRVTDYETRQPMVLWPAANLLFYSNIVMAPDSGTPVVHSTLETNDWATFLPTYVGYNNVWYAPGTRDIFRLLRGPLLTVEEWRAATNQDCDSIYRNVAFRNPSGNDFTLTEGNPLPNRPAVALSSPSGTLTSGLGNPTYTWNAIDGVSTYELAVFRADNMRTPHYYSGVLNGSQVCSNGTCSANPVGSIESTRLYNGAHVAYMRANGCGWRGPYNFNVNIPAPGAVSDVRTSGADTLRPTAHWTLSGEGTNATWFYVYVIEKTLFDQAQYTRAAVQVWLSRSQVCGSPTGTECQVQSNVNLRDNTRYYLFVQAAGPGGYSVGGEFNNGWGGDEFRVNTLPDPDLPSNISVSVNEGRPTIRWNDDSDATRYHISIMNWTTLQWVYTAVHAKGSAGLNCNGTTCSLLSDAMVFANGSYSVFVMAEGPGGTSIDGPFNNGYNGPQNPQDTSEPGDFVLNFNAPSLVSADSMNATTSSGQVQVSFEGVTGATWYSVWIGTAGATQTRHMQWYSSTALNCQNKGTCTLSIPLNLGAGQYYVAVQSAGPGGFSTGGMANNGYQVRETPISTP